MSELERSDKFSRSRLYYYTDVKFFVNNLDINVTLKIDTGSPYTIIGLSKLDSYKKIKNYILDNSEVIDPIQDASGNAVDLRTFVVENFYLTKDVVFDKVLIYFSDVMNNKAVLGMDIISIFAHSYILDGNNTSGVYWLHSIETAIERLEKFKSELGYYNPKCVLSTFLKI